MVVALSVTGTNGNGSAFFNILPAGQNCGDLYVGSNDDDNRVEVTVPSDGDWAIRVYLLGNDKDTDKTAGYSIEVYIGRGGGGTTDSDIPDLAMSGAKDTQTNPDAAERVVRSLTRSQAVLFPEAGHAVIQFSQCARDVAEGFLEDPFAPVNAACAEALKPRFYIPVAEK